MPGTLDQSTRVQRLLRRQISRTTKSPKRTHQGIELDVVVEDEELTLILRHKSDDHPRNLEKLSAYLHQALGGETVFSKGEPLEGIGDLKHFRKLGKRMPYLETEFRGEVEVRYGITPQFWYLNNDTMKTTFRQYVLVPVIDAIQRTVQ